MEILWLIFKIILLVLLWGMGIFCSIIVIILFIPIKYEVYLEYYEMLNYEVKISALHFLKSYFNLEEGKKNRYFILFWKRINSIRKKKDLQNEISQQESQQEQRTVENTEGAINRNNDKLNNKSSDLLKQNVKQTIQSDQEDQVQSISRKDSKRTLSNEENSLDKSLFLCKDFLSFVGAGVHFLKKLIIYLGPKEFSFELIVGKEDRAETGELIAKLTMLYPLYYKYGVIKGNYEKAGVSGGFLACGKFCIGGILCRVILFLIDKDTRNYIKLILKNRKGERNGE